MQENGWIKLHRKMLDWQWINDPNVFLVFTRLLLKASHKDHMWGTILIKRGDVITGRIQLSKEIGISIRSVRTALTKLKTTNELTIKTNNKYSVISINNYDDYQQNDQQNDKRTTSKRPANDHIQECKEGKECKEIDTYVSLFNSLFGTNYKTTIGRTKKISLRLKVYSMDQIKLATENLAASPFHTGTNDRGWKADPDFLIKSDEQIDKWLNNTPENKAQPKRYIKLLGEENS